MARVAKKTAIKKPVRKTAAKKSKPKAKAKKTASVFDKAAALVKSVEKEINVQTKKVAAARKK